MPCPTPPEASFCPEHQERSLNNALDPSGLDDPLYLEAAAALPADEAMPVSFLQRRFRIGYHRAQRLKEAIRGAAADRDESPAPKE